MSDLISLDTHCFQPFDAIEGAIRRLPTQPLKKNSPTASGAYLDLWVDMVSLEDTIAIFKQFIVTSELHGLTRLPDKIWTKIEKQLRNIPSRKLKIDPLYPYSQSSTALVEEDYIEIDSALQLLDRWKPNLLMMEKLILECLCQTISLKENWLIDAEISSGFARTALPPLEGNPEEVERSRQIRERAIAALDRLDPVKSLPEIAKNHIHSILQQFTSASWWIHNENWAIRAILLQINYALDDRIMREFSRF
jgi:hypothetical protein